MESEGLYISENIMNDYIERLNVASKNIDNHNSNINNNFSGLKNTGIYNDGFEKISKGLIKTMETINNSNKTNMEYMGTFGILENKGKTIASQLVVPNISKVSPSLTLSKINETTLEKNDGERVKDGKTEEVEIEDKYNISEESIAKILKDIDQSLIESVNIDLNKTDLGELNTNSDNEEVVFDDRFNTLEEKNLNNINNEKEQENVEMNEYYNDIMGKENLVNIKKEQITERSE